MKKKRMKDPELEVMSNNDGAWYDLDRPNTRVQGGRLRIRFCDFPASDFEFFTIYDLDLKLRVRSVPVEDNECWKIISGMRMCTFALFTETDERKWMDAHVIDVQRSNHAAGEECTCRFKMRWVKPFVKGTSQATSVNFQLPDPCWVGVDRLCNLQGKWDHLQHPKIVRWKLKMLYEGSQKFETFHPRQAQQGSIEPTGVSQHNESMDDSHTGQRYTSGRICSPAMDHGHAVSSSVQRDIECANNYAPGEQCSSEQRPCSMNCPKPLENSTQTANQMLRMKKRKWLEACLKDAQQNSRRKAKSSTVLEGKKKQFFDMLDGSQSRPRAHSSPSQSNAWRIDRLFGSSCKEAVPQSELYRNGHSPVGGYQIDGEKADAMLPKNSLPQSVGRRVLSESHAGIGHEVKANKCHQFMVPNLEMCGKEFSYFMAGFIKGIKSSSIKAPTTSKVSTPTRKESVKFHSNQQKDNQSDGEFTPSWFGWSCARALPIDVIKTQKNSRRNMDDWFPQVKD